MDVVVLAVELHQFGLDIGADAGEHRAQLVQNFFCEDFTAVFSDEDQVHMHQKNAVPSMSNLVVIADGANYHRSMQRLQAFKYALMPDGEQERNMRRFAGSCRFVYNKALALQMDNHEAGNKFIGYVAMAKHLTAWRNGDDTPWLKQAPCHPLQHALKDLEKAYKNFFAKRTGFPRFKRKGCGDAFRYPDPTQIKLDQVNSRIFCPSSAGCAIAIAETCWARCATSR